MCRCSIDCNRVSGRVSGRGILLISLWLSLPQCTLYLAPRVCTLLHSSARSAGIRTACSQYECPGDTDSDGVEPLIRGDSGGCREEDHQGGGLFQRLVRGVQLRVDAASLVWNGQVSRLRYLCVLGLFTRTRAQVPCLFLCFALYTRKPRTNIARDRARPATLAWFWATSHGFPCHTHLVALHSSPRLTEHVC